MEALTVLDFLTRGFVLPAILIMGVATLGWYIRAAHREGMARLAAYEARESARKTTR
jgi:hypothetical protein